MCPRDFGKEIRKKILKNLPAIFKLAKKKVQEDEESEDDVYLSANESDSIFAGPILQSLVSSSPDLVHPELPPFKMTQEILDSRKVKNFVKKQMAHYEEE